GWNYTLKASALLADPINMFNLKRALDLGQMDPSEAPADVVVGRSAWSDRRTNAEALEAAARASREFRRTPLDVRRAMSDEYHDSIVARADEFAEILAPILERHGAPPGTLNIISGDTKQILRQWIASPHVNDVMFFGDSAVGMKIGADCASNGKKAVLELSGNDAIVVWEDADVEA